MLTNLSTPRKDQSIKLSVTVKSRLEGKYAPTDLQKINNAVKGWIEADAKRGIQTVHVHVDDTKEMNDLGVAAVLGEATAEKIKRAIDELWNKLTPTPHYLVLFGGDDIVPMFQAPNPSGWEEPKPDATVPTDNPYATHLCFLPSDPTNSYVIPERAIGRIPDRVGDPDPGWFLDYLETAINWKPQAHRFYELSYAICTAEAKDAATEFMQKALNKAGLHPFVCPPDEDSSPKTRDQLSARLHITKCHGNQGDATVWGFSEEDQFTKKHPYAAITSATVRALLEPSTVVASMCCYGAQIFSPSDPKAESPYAWPLASTYLRKGALGFVGSTMMAWVGRSAMGPADWIVQGYLKNVLAGDSLGCAFLACKQDYQSHYSLKDDILSSDEQKTLIEYILLGDPSIHPVSSAQSSKALLAFQSRHRRRDARAKLAAGIRSCLPTRSDATDAEKAMAEDVFISAKKGISKDDIEKLEQFNIKPTAVQVKRVDAPLPDSPETRQSLEYYWSGKRNRGGQKQFCLLKSETDRKGKLVPGRTAVLYTS
jgi:Peptidase family C25